MPINLERLRTAIGDLRELMIQNGVRVDEPTGIPYFTGYRMGVLFDIDLYFEGVVLCYMGMGEHVKNGVRLFLMEQQENGWTPRRVQRWRQLNYTMEGGREHCKPFLAQAALMVSQLDEDYSWLSLEMFSRLHRYLNYWLNECDRNGNGLSEWASAMQAGCDNQYERAGGWQAHYCEGVDLNSYLYRECLALARLGDALGHTHQACDLRHIAAARKKAIQEQLWDEEDGFFYDRDRYTGERIRVKYLLSFAALWAGVATAEQARSCVSRYLMNREEFWTPFPAGTYAQSEPKYRQEAAPDDYCKCNHCGSVWIPYNYIVMQGLRRCGFDDGARELASRTIELYLRHEHPREWYNAETGEGCGQEPFWGFSGLAPFMPLELECGCDPTTLEGAAVAQKIKALRGAAGALS